MAICGDPNRLRQIMANLLGNAIKFTNEGRMLARVRIASEDNQAVMLRFEVHDTGIGISREARGRIFEAFSQADDSTTRKYGGTGLGLAISKQLVELMGGAIGVENALPRAEGGSVFWFTVAFDKRRVDPDEPGDHQHTIDGLRVLVVDEQPDQPRRPGAPPGRLARRLRRRRSADEALERLHDAAREGRPYDVAILDMELDQASGLLLAAGIKSDPATRATRLILLSPERLAADPVQRREAGVAYQLIKPARAADLFACLATRPRGRSRRRRAHPAAPAAPAQRPAAQRAACCWPRTIPSTSKWRARCWKAWACRSTARRNGAEALQAVRQGGATTAC